MSNERAMTAAERSELQKIYSHLPSASARFRRSIGEGLLLCAVTLLVFVVGWNLIAWLTARIAHANFGWRSRFAFPVLAVGAVGCGLFAVIYAIRRIRRWQDMRPLVLADLSRGVVTEDSMEFTETKRFQEPEHGGLIYFLRTKDNKVLVLYDHQSQDLGVQGKDPFTSSFQPQAQCRIVRAPTSRLVLGRIFSGPTLPPGKPLYLAAPPKQWPETEEFCDIPWDDLDVHLGQPA